jgi:uncharacterized protein YjiS (DUF1127 family)
MRHEDRHEDAEFFILNGGRPTPAGYSLRHREIVERAKAMRVELLREIWRQVRSWYQRRLALAQLRALDDATLKDIGLHRSGIEAAVDKRLTGTAPQKRRTFPEKPYLCLQRTR